MKKWIIAIISLTFVIASSIFYFQAQKETPSVPVHPTAAVETIGTPVTLTIPSLQVSASVESVGLDTKKRMDIPKNFEDVAWYSLGFKPGQKGSAVIDGHVDTPTGAPAVFAHIANLQLGDKIIIKDSLNKAYTFSVIKVIAYPFDQLPLQSIFDSTDTSRLNLITCAGKWDRLSKNYSQRTVVYAVKE